jgi:hypothetical protein
MENEFLTELSYESAKKVINESDLTQDDKTDYLIFIENFKDLDFYSNKEIVLSNIESENNIELPPNLKIFRQTLASVLYGKKAMFKFKNFLNQTPRTGEIEKLWYSIGMNVFSFEGSNRKILLESSSSLRLIPIAKTDGKRNSSGYYLGMNFINNDKSIYEFNILDIFDKYNENKPIEESAYPVFTSYPQMLAHISEIKYLNGKKEVIVKARGE